jgi:hypothetical protein
MWTRCQECFDRNVAIANNRARVGLDVCAQQPVAGGRGLDESDGQRIPRHGDCRKPGYLEPLRAVAVVNDLHARPGYMRISRQH